MFEWHHQLDGQEFEQASGVVDGQGSLSCCHPGAAKSQTRLSDQATTKAAETQHFKATILQFLKNKIKCMLNIT